MSNITFRYRNEIYHKCISTDQSIVLRYTLINSLGWPHSAMCAVRLYTYRRHPRQALSDAPRPCSECIAGMQTKHTTRSKFVLHCKYSNGNHERECHAKAHQVKRPDHRIPLCVGTYPQAGCEKPLRDYVWPYHDRYPFWQTFGIHRTQGASQISS